LGTPAGPRIVALVPEPERIARLRAAFGDACRVLQSPPDVIEASRSDDVDFVVVSPLDCQGRPLSTAVAAIRASRRSPPVQVYTDRSIESVRELMPLARAGACGIIIAGVDDESARLRQLLDARTLQQAVATVTIAAHGVVKARYAPLIVRCLEHITEPESAADFARSLRVSRRTLTAWANSAGVRGVRSVTSRCRVLVALELLRDRRRSVEDVALELRFASSAHLHNTITRYTGLRPRQGAPRDAAAWCEALFPAASVRASSPPPSPPEESRPPPAEWRVMPNGTTLSPDQAQPEE
jgi:AraC-like DNA-binding protein